MVANGSTAGGPSACGGFAYLDILPTTAGVGSIAVGNGSTFERCSAPQGGGGAFCANAAVVPSTAPALWNGSAVVTIDQAALRSNSAATGGALFLGAVTRSPCRACPF